MVRESPIVGYRGLGRSGVSPVSQRGSSLDHKGFLICHRVLLKVGGVFRQSEDSVRSKRGPSFKDPSSFEKKMRGPGHSRETLVGQGVIYRDWAIR